MLEEGAGYQAVHLVQTEGELGSSGQTGSFLVLPGQLPVGKEPGRIPGQQHNAVLVVQGREVAGASIQVLEFRSREARRHLFWSGLFWGGLFWGGLFWGGLFWSGLFWGGLFQWSEVRLKGLEQLGLGQAAVSSEPLFLRQGQQLCPDHGLQGGDSFFTHLGSPRRPRSHPRGRSLSGSNWQRTYRSYPGPVSRTARPRQAGPGSCRSLLPRSMPPLPGEGGHRGSRPSVEQALRPRGI